MFLVCAGCIEVVIYRTAAAVKLPYIYICVGVRVCVGAYVGACVYACVRVNIIIINCREFTVLLHRVSACPTEQYRGTQLQQNNMVAINDIQNVLVQMERHFRMAFHRKT